MSSGGGIRWLVLGLALLTGGTVASSAERPNVIVLVASGSGWEQAMDRKPGGPLDRLARLRTEGATLRRFYGNPVAAAGDAELLTGRHFLRNGVSGDANGEQVLHELEITIAEVCRDAGYRTGFFGWWRHGVNVPQHPVFQGFERFTGQCRADWTGGTGSRWVQRGTGPETPVPDPWAAVDQDAVSFAGEPGNAPFLCWVCVPPGDSSLQILNGIAGHLLQKVKETGRSDQTLTVLVSDRPGPDSNGRLFGKAGTLSEGGVRIPGFWHWPGAIEPGLVIHEVSQNFDLFATVASLAGGTVPGDRVIDGVDLTPLLRNQRPERWPNRDIINVAVSHRDRSTARTAFRNTNWLAVRDPEFRRNPKLSPGETWELFDLQSDPLQLYEIGDTYPFVLARLKSDFCRWHLDAAQIDLKPVALSVGRPDAPETRLLAELADQPQRGELRWELRTAAAIEVEVVWNGTPGPWNRSWNLRFGEVEAGSEPVRGESGWSFGPVQLPCGKVEAVLDGVPGDFASRGELVLRAVNP